MCKYPEYTNVCFLCEIKFPVTNYAMIIYSLPISHGKSLEQTPTPRLSLSLTLTPIHTLLIYPPIPLPHLPSLSLSHSL